MERRPRSAPAARRVAPIPDKRPGSAHAWTEAKRRDAKREELLALIEGCGVEPVLEAASQTILKTDPTRAKAAPCCMSGEVELFQGGFGARRVRVQYFLGRGCEHGGDAAAFD